jgi:hypothetical protein
VKIGQKSIFLPSEPHILIRLDVMLLYINFMGFWKRSCLTSKLKGASFRFYQKNVWSRWKQIENPYFNPRKCHILAQLDVTVVVGQDPPTGIDRQHESREARSLYLSALQLTHVLRLRFVGRATWPIPSQKGIWCASVSFLYKQTHVNISPSRSRLFGWLLHRLWRADGNPS